MTNTTMDLTELVQKHNQGGLLRLISEAVVQLMLENDIDGLIGAAAMSAPSSARLGATATVTARWIPDWEH